MSKISELVPERVKALPAYVPGKAIKQAEAETGVRSIKLASNENPFGPSPLAIEAIRRAAAEANWYPDADSSELRQALAARHSVPADSVMIAAGSSSFLYVIGR